jgi:hypothetical protein
VAVCGWTLILQESSCLDSLELVSCLNLVVQESGGVGYRVLACSAVRQDGRVRLHIPKQEKSRLSPSRTYAQPGLVTWEPETAALDVSELIGSPGGHGCLLHCPLAFRCCLES